jgi:hypothetical protein
MGQCKFETHLWLAFLTFSTFSVSLICILCWMQQLFLRAKLVKVLYGTKDSTLAYWKLSIHKDPFIHLSPVLHAILQLQDFLWSKLCTQMPEYLWDEMIVLSLLKTNF